MRTRAASGVVGARHIRPVRHGRPGWTQRLLAILATLITTGLIGAAVGATSEQAARHYFGSDPVEFGLARAVAAGNAHQVSWLVAHGADPDSVGADNITMLQWAIEARSPNGMQALLAAGALRDRLGRAGRAPVDDAARLADPRYVQNPARRRRRSRRTSRLYPDDTVARGLPGLGARNARGTGRRRG